MAKPWSDVANSDEFKALDPQQQDQARQQYFDQVVKPQVPATDLDAARTQFLQSTAPAVPESQQRAEKVANFSESGPMAGATDTLLKGASFGTSDPVMAGMSAATRGLENLGLRAAGMPTPYSAGEAYDATLKARRGAEKRFSDAHPVASTVTDLAGGFAAPAAGELANFVGRGANAVGRIARSALVGTGAGAISGTETDEGNTAADHLYAGLKSGAIGGTLGIALPALGSLSAPVAKRVGSALNEAWNQARTAVTGEAQSAKPLTPEQQQQATQYAGKIITDLMQKSGKSFNDLLQDPAFLAGKPITSAETIGRPGITQLMAIGRRQGLTPDQLESFLRQRTQEMPDRVVNTLGKQAGVEPNAVQGNFDSLSNELRQKADPLYKTAYDAGPVSSEKLTELMNRPSVKQALSGALDIAREKGRNPQDIGLVEVPSQIIDGATGQPRSVSTIEVRKPTLETWDYIKRALGDIVYRDKDAVGRPNLDTKGNAIRGTLDDLRDELFKISKPYERAVAAGGEPIRMREAYQNIPKLMKNSVPESDFAKAVSRYSPAEMEAAKGGFINDVYTKSRGGSLRLKDMVQPAFVTKARTLLGKDQADEFIKDVALEQRLTANAHRMMPGTNSVTNDLAATEKEIDSALSNVMHGAKDVAQGNLGSAAMRFIKSAAAGGQAPHSLAERNEIGRMLQLPPDQLQQAVHAASGQIGGATSPADSLIQQILSRGVIAGADVAGQ